jgi:hypothetical protein
MLSGVFRMTAYIPLRELLPLELSAAAEYR